MFLERTERLALVDFENKHINYIDLINNIKYFSEYIVEIWADCYGKSSRMDLQFFFRMG